MIDWDGELEKRGFTRHVLSRAWENKSGVRARVLYVDGYTKFYKQGHRQHCTMAHHPSAIDEAIAWLERRILAGDAQHAK